VRVIQPRKGEFQAQVRVLLDLADDKKRDVVTTTEYERLAVVVPEELYQRYVEYQTLSASPPKVPKKKASQK
jgi:PHD/YefM family antitoxin component YafN of YafNO toxin-antitoxin module